MARRGVKEYKPPQALELILADRDSLGLVCPCCGAKKIQRTPRRRLRHVPGDRYRHVRLTCTKCGRSAAYYPMAVTQPAEPQYS